jgi:hypothetical protein
MSEPFKCCVRQVVYVRTPRSSAYNLDTQIKFVFLRNEIELPVRPSVGENLAGLWGDFGAGQEIVSIAFLPKGPPLEWVERCILTIVDFEDRDPKEVVAKYKDWGWMLLSRADPPACSFFEWLIGAPPKRNTP